MKWLKLLPCIFLLTAASALSAEESTSSLISNGNFDADSKNKGWPDDWGKAPGITYEADEAGKRFLRLESQEPGQNVMLYRLIPIPQGVKAVEISARYHTENVRRGKQPWYDARIMMDFLDNEKKQLQPTPPPIVFAEKTSGWIDISQRCAVPEGTTQLQMIPAVFQAASGLLDLAEIRVIVLEGDAAAEVVKQASEKKSDETPKIAQPETSTGSLIANGDFETTENGAPAGWGLAPGITLEQEEGRHFLRLHASEPDKMLMVYRLVVLPKDAKALELTCRMRCANLKPGDKPWFDARIMMNFKNAQNETVEPSPPPPYSNTDTTGWMNVNKRFLVPNGAVTLEVMPCLFQVKSGTLDLDALSLTVVNAEAVKAEVVANTPPAEPAVEAPVKEKWPETIHVVGNRLQTLDGKSVWLQGVNVVSLEWSVNGESVLTSVKTAIDGWKSNIVRLPVKDSFWFGKDRMQTDGGESYRKFVDAVITFVANRGGYVLLDLHKFHAPRAEDVTFWADAAARYKNHPAVIFDIFNEPHSVSWEVWRNGGFVEEKTKPADEDNFLSPEEKAKAALGYKSPGMQALVTAVRKTGANNVIAAGGLDWAYDLSGVMKGFALTDTKEGNGIMYSTHIYNWKRGWEEKVLKTASKYPIIIGECGADTNKMTFIPANAQEDPYTWVPDFLGLIQKHKLHWTGFSFHPSATPVMISDWKFTPTPFWGAPAKEALAGKQYELKKLR